MKFMSKFKKNSFIVFFLCVYNATLAADFYEIKNSVKKETLHDLSKCAFEGDRECQMKLGFAYLYGISLKDIDVDKDVIKAKELISKTIIMPYSRYLLGYIDMVKENRMKTKISLMQSSCMEGIEEACVVVVKVYSTGKQNYDKYDLQSSNENNVRKAIFFDEKAINIAENKIKAKKWILLN